jgi:hypothetical protein
MPYVMDPHVTHLTPPEVLHQRAASIRAVRGTEQNVYSLALAALERAASAIDSPVAIIGALAGIRHGSSVTTTAIDIVVALGNMAAFLAAAEAEGLFVKTHAADGRHSLHYLHGLDTVAVEILPEGWRAPRDPADAPPIPRPRDLGVERGLGYASLQTWVALKLVANRDKDRYHLVEVLKVAGPEEIAACVQAVRKLPSRYLAEFERLVCAAEDERCGKSRKA